MSVQIMGVLNVTPDSFFDGGHHHTTEKAIEHGLRLINEGADIIDIGGESTRPGANPVSIDEECMRVIPVIEALKERTDIPLSIDTRHTAVMKAAIEAGVSIINDVAALSDKGAMALASQHDITICLMHMQGTPESMQHAPHYQHVVSEVHLFLKQRLLDCLQAGIKKENIWIDPGFGFGKNLSHNLALLASLQQLTALGVPVLVGLSRKSMFGEIVNKPADQRLYASLAGAVIASLQGASIIRTHDVMATKDAIAVVQAVQPYLQRRTTDVCAA